MFFSRSFCLEPALILAAVDGLVVMTEIIQRGSLTET